MNFEEFTTFISRSLESRFMLVEQDEYMNSIVSLASDNLKEIKAYRFYRDNPSIEQNKYLKTLLIAGINKLINLKEVLEWTALSKDILIDPETSDIYLFIFWHGETKPTLEECLRIEATEDFCRKFVLRPDENEVSFIERTFIYMQKNPIPLDLGVDPLLSTFSDLGNQYSWFDEAEQKKWRLAFNSNMNGNELFNLLMDYKTDIL